jgi:hypothetical protein
LKHGTGVRELLNNVFQGTGRIQYEAYVVADGQPWYMFGGSFRGKFA